MLVFISHDVAGKADTSSCFQLVGSANHQPVIWCSVTPTAYCVGDVKLHKASGSEREDGDCLWLSFCLSVVVIQSKVLCAPQMTVVSPAAGGLSFIPRFPHQVNLHIARDKRSVRDGMPAWFVSVHIVQIHLGALEL